MDATEPTELPESQFEIRRSFNWGVLIVADSSTTDIPLSVGATGIEATATALAVSVRHAQDVDTDDAPFVVSVVLRRGAAPSPPTAEVVLDVPSGTIKIGDADHVDRFRLEPGSWTVAVSLAPRDHPSAVSLWFAPPS